MSAERLREAARVLRERASLAIHETAAISWCAEITDSGIARVNGRDGVRLLAMHGYPASATYIATMHPGVGLALADWLDKQAATYLEDWSDRWVEQAATAVADAILGGAA